MRYQTTSKLVLILNYWASAYKETDHIFMKLDVYVTNNYILFNAYTNYSSSSVLN